MLFVCVGKQSSGSFILNHPHKKGTTFRGAQASVSSMQSWPNQRHPGKNGYKCTTYLPIWLMVKLNDSIPWSKWFYNISQKPWYIVLKGNTVYYFGDPWKKGDDTTLHCNYIALYIYVDTCLYFMFSLQCDIWLYITTTSWYKKTIRNNF